MEPADDLAVIGGYLARRDSPGPSADHPADVLVLCGSAVLPSLDVAAAALRDGAVQRILVTGGIGHSTPFLYAAVGDHAPYADVPVAGRTEAAVIGDLLRLHHGVDAALVDVEEEATNCGENAELSMRLLAGRSEPVRGLVVVQDPTMQRRTHASFERSAGPGVVVRSLAPFVPVVGELGAGPDASTVVWTLDRFRDLVLGEVRRLTDDEHGYGPCGTGFVGHVDVPPDVSAAAERLRATYPTSR